MGYDGIVMILELGYDGRVMSSELGYNGRVIIQNWAMVAGIFQNWAMMQQSYISELGYDGRVTNRRLSCCVTDCCWHSISRCVAPPHTPPPLSPPPPPPPPPNVFQFLSLLSLYFFSFHPICIYHNPCNFQLWAH